MLEASISDSNVLDIVDVRWISKSKIFKVYTQIGRSGYIGSLRSSNQSYDIGPRLIQPNKVVIQQVKQWITFCCKNHRRCANRKQNNPRSLRVIGYLTREMQTCKAVRWHSLLMLIIPPVAKIFPDLFYTAVHFLAQCRFRRLYSITWLTITIAYIVHIVRSRYFHTFRLQIKKNGQFTISLPTFIFRHLKEPALKRFC